MLLYHLSHLVSWEAPTKKNMAATHGNTDKGGGEDHDQGGNERVRLRRNENRNGTLHVAERGCEKNVGLLSKGKKCSKRDRRGSAMPDKHHIPA
jgi:hypothetical protein